LTASLEARVINVYALPKELSEGIGRHFETFCPPLGRIEVIADIDRADLILDEFLADGSSRLCSSGDACRWHTDEQVLGLARIYVDRDVYEFSERHAELRLTSVVLFWDL